jgi:hypothetical protein
MPSPDRVVKEIRGKDEQNSIERQMGAFKHLLKIIDSMAYGLEHRSLQFPNKVTPDEARQKESYGKAFAELWYKAKNHDAWTDYVHDGDLWDEMMSKLFSKNFQELYRQSDNNTAVVMEKHRKESEGVVFGGSPAQAGGGNDFLGLCAAKGLDPITCFVQTGMKNMIKASNEEPVVPGLRMSGVYRNGKFSVNLNPYGDGAWVNCGDVVLISQYLMDRRNNQIVVQIENEGDSFTLALRPDGTSLSGPISVPIHGHSPSGGGGSTTTASAGGVPRTVETTRTRELTPLEARQYPGATKNGQTYTVNETTTSTEYDPLPSSQPAPWPAKTAPCNIGTVRLFIPPEGAATEKPDDLFSKMFPDNGERTPNGLRMLGTYSGEGGAQIRFMAEKAIIRCGSTILEKPYSVTNKGGSVSIDMEGSGGPKAFVLRADGSLEGDNVMLLIRGKQKIGEDKLGDESFAPSSNSCAYGALSPQGLKQTSSIPVQTSSQPVRPTQTTPQRAAGPAQPQPAAATSARAGTGSLKVTSGYAGQAENPLANASILFLKESVEDVLRRSGFGGSSGRSAISAWADACKAASPACAGGRQAILKARVNVAKLDANGDVGFTNIPIGTYWIVTEVTHNQHSYVWNQRVDIASGQNAAVLGKANVVANF